MNDDEIAQILTAEEYRSPGLQNGVLVNTVRGIRRRHGITVARRQTRWPVVPGCLTVTQVVERLGVPRKWLCERLRRGILQTMREASGRYLIPDVADALEAIRALRAGNIHQLDLREHHHD
jgi:hypothetical protein